MGLTHNLEDFRIRRLQCLADLGAHGFNVLAAFLKTAGLLGIHRLSPIRLRDAPSFTSPTAECMASTHMTVMKRIKAIISVCDRRGQCWRGKGCRSCAIAGKNRFHQVMPLLY